MIRRSYRTKTKPGILIPFVRFKLGVDRFWQESALRLLYGNQTKYEQFINQTIPKNLRGFNKQDAKAVKSIISEYILLNKKLSSSRWRELGEILPKYAKQIFKMFPDIQAKAETEILDEITSGGYKISDRERAMMSDLGAYDRTSPFGDEPEFAENPNKRLIYTSSQRREAMRNRRRRMAETAYQKYFRSIMDKWDIESPDELSKAEKKKFFDEVDSGWKGKSEKRASSQNMRTGMDNMRVARELVKLAKELVDGKQRFVFERMRETTKNNSEDKMKNILYYKNERDIDDAIDQITDMGFEMVKRDSKGRFYMNEDGVKARVKKDMKNGGGEISVF